MHTNNDKSESEMTNDRITEDAYARSTSESDDGLLPTDIGPGEEGDGEEDGDGDGDDDDGDDDGDTDGGDSPTEGDPTSALDMSGDRTDNESADLDQDSASVIRRLQAENDKLKIRARRYAVFGDVLFTIAMLPLTTEKTTDTFRSRVDAALVMHGLPVDSPVSSMISRGFIKLAASERERIIRAVTEVANLRISERGNPTTKGCNCALCQSIDAAMVLNKSPRKPNERDSARMAQHDFFLTKDLRKVSTHEEAEQTVQEAHDLLDLIQDLSGPTGGGGGIFDLLEALLGGDPNAINSMGMPGGLPGLPPGISVMSLGPNGLQGMPPELAALLGGGGPGEGDEPDPETEEPSQDAPESTKKRVKGMLGKLADTVFGDKDKKRPAARAKRSHHAKHEGHDHD